MSWCDKLASTPAIGIAFEPHYQSSSTMLESLAPVMNRLSTSKKAGFSLGKIDPVSVQILGDDGFEFGIEGSRLFVDFKHRMKLRQVSAGAPELHMLSKPVPFTHLLREMEGKLLEIYDRLDPKGERRLLRIGVVSSTIVSTKDVPPGITKFINHVRSPWETDDGGFNINISGLVDKRDAWTDRCLHGLSTIEDEEGLVTLRFDYQRTYAKLEPAKASRIADLMPAVAKSALEYFESLAQGDRFDVGNN